MAASGSEALAGAVLRLAPELHRRVAGDLWAQPLATGAALEWATVGGIVAAAESRGWQAEWPEPVDPASFRMRSDIPLTFGALAGNSAAPPPAAWLEAFRPKCVLREGGRAVSLFREGCGYHRAATRQQYRDRPDILLLEGAPLPGFPRLEDDEQVAAFAFSAAGEAISGSVMVENAPMPRMEEPYSGPSELPFVGVVECSVRKEKARFEKQFADYRDVFAGGRPVPGLAVCGEPTPALSVPLAVIPLAEPEAALLAMGEQACDVFGLR